MRSRPTLSTKLLAMGAGFLLVALASIGLTLWVTWKLEGGAAAVNEAGRLRMNMLRMVLVLQTEPPEAVQERARQFDASLESVSYTHLRAHETREDLVCRLLLEKKKSPRD